MSPPFNIEPAGVFAPTLFSEPLPDIICYLLCAQIVLINICASLIYFDPLLEARGLSPRLQA